jgi:hypothetical protein
MDLQLGCQSSTVNIMSGVPGKAIPFRSVTVYSKNLSSQYKVDVCKETENVCFSPTTWVHHQFCGEIRVAPLFSVVCFCFYFGLYVRDLKTGIRARFTVFSSFAPNTHKLYILRHCINIALILQKNHIKPSTFIF